MTFRLRQLREWLGMSRPQLSEKTGIPVNMLWNQETKGNPTIQQVETIAKACNVDPAWLAGWADDDEVKDKPEVQVIEKVVEKTVEVTVVSHRLPPYYINDNDGKLIKWKETKKPLQKRK